MTLTWPCTLCLSSALTLSVWPWCDLVLYSLSVVCFNSVYMTLTWPCTLCLSSVLTLFIWPWCDLVLSVCRLFQLCLYDLDVTLYSLSVICFNSVYMMLLMITLTFTEVFVSMSVVHGGGGWPKLKYLSSKFAISWQQHKILWPILHQLLSTNRWINPQNYAYLYVKKFTVLQMWKHHFQILPSDCCLLYTSPSPRD